MPGCVLAKQVLLVLKAVGVDAKRTVGQSVQTELTKEFLKQSSVHAYNYFNFKSLKPNRQLRGRMIFFLSLYSPYGRLLTFTKPKISIKNMLIYQNNVFVILPI